MPCLVVVESENMGNGITGKCCTNMGSGNIGAAFDQSSSMETTLKLQTIRQMKSLNIQYMEVGGGQRVEYEESTFSKMLFDSVVRKELGEFERVKKPIIHDPVHQNMRTVNGPKN